MLLRLAIVPIVVAVAALVSTCASPPPPKPPPPKPEVVEEPEPEPTTPQNWAGVVDMYGSKCPGPFFELPAPMTVDAAGKSWTITGSTIKLASDGPWEGPLKIGVLGAIKDADADTKRNIKKAAALFKRFKVDIVVANGDLIGDEAGDLPKVLEMIGETIKVPIFAHSGNYEWTTAFTEGIEAASKKHPHLFNANLLRHVDLGGVHVFSLPGWSVRKYVKPAACFYAKEDVDALREQMEPLVKKGDVVILSAHGPPRGRGKQSLDFAFEAGNVGDEDLARMLVEVPVRFGIFSHILEAGGRATTDVTRQPPIKLPMRKATSTLFVNAGSASSYPYAMLDKKTSRGIAAIVHIDDTKSGKARVAFIKLR